MEIFIVEFYEKYEAGPFEIVAFSTESLAKAYGAQRIHQILSQDDPRWCPQFSVYKLPVMENLSLLNKYDDQVKQKEMGYMWDGRKSTVGD